MRLAALLVGGLCAACVSMDNLRAAVRARAAGELRCDPAQLAVVQVEGNLGLSGFEVEGCRKRRSYAARCYVSNFSGYCDVAAASGTTLLDPPAPER